MYNERMRYRLVILASLFIVTACGPKTTPNPSIQIDQAVAATLAALPVPTSAPLPTPYPSPTPVDLKGLFCEYQFCIGHPVDMAFFDLSAQQNTGAPSTYTQGMLAAYNANLFIQLLWQTSPGTTNPQFLLDLILQDGIDTPVGTPEAKLVRNMNVLYTAITTTATQVLPFGGAAAWTCGDRVFAWKVYAPDEASASGLFESALARFTCGP
jgi:hypothetical protein